MALASPMDRPFDELLRGLPRYLSQGEGTVAEKLARLYAHWGMRATEMNRLFAEADLDGDGKGEVVAALNGASGVTGTGALLVLYEANGALAIDRAPGDLLPGVGLFQVADLTGDGRAEIIWQSVDMGAHTATAQLFASHWEPGRWTTLPGKMASTNAEWRLEGRDLLLTGGEISSAGAGLAQRVRTDRYRWVDTGFRRVDQQFARSSFAYHRLIDGIAAETYGRGSDAEQAYRDAMAEQLPALPDEMLQPEHLTDFAQAVHAYARDRKSVV